MRAALRDLDPLIAAERERGNKGRLEFGTMRDDRARFQLRAQIDVEALRAQFDFGEGILLDYEGQGGRVAFLGRSNDVLFVILGTPDRGWASNRRRAAWWTAWNATPHTRVPFANPFADLPG